MADPPDSVEVALGNTLDRWGISPPPWAPCDSGADFTSLGSDVLRCWNHVDLGVGSGQTPHEDIPISGLLRTTWDGMELYGHLVLTGVDAIVPTRFAGEAMSRRIFGSVLRDPARRPTRHANVAVAARAVHAADWDVDAVSAALAGLVRVRKGVEIPPLFPSRPSLTPTPFMPHEKYSFGSAVVLDAWTIDDAAWLAEAVSVSCLRGGVPDDIEIAITLLED